MRAKWIFHLVNKRDKIVVTGDLNIDTCSNSDHTYNKICVYNNRFFSYISH